MLADRGGDRREVVVKIDGNGNGRAPFSFHGADAAGDGGGGKAGNATSGTNSTATTPRTESRPRSSETSSPRSPAKVWREGSYEFWNNGGGGAAAPAGANGRPAATEAFSFKNRPPQASSPSMSPQQQQPPEGGGGVDPPTRLIANFLRKQAAFGGEMSLDLDLEMEELGRTAQLRAHPSFSSSLERGGRVSFQEPQKRHSTSSCSSDSDTDDGRKRRGDDGEVVRCTSSSTAAGAGPLLRVKTRSRLMDPPPQWQTAPAPAPASAPAASPAFDEDRKSSGVRTPTKSGRLFSRLMSGNKSGPIGGKSGPMDEEEDDPFVDEDIPDDFKRGKLDALTVLQWLGLFLIIAALACSLSIKILSTKKVLGLHLWKWELLVFVLICGRLVSGWVIRIAVFGVERNFLLRKRVLYFVYGVRSAVQNALWLGLVLASWHFLFDKNVQQETNSPVLPYVTKILFCLLVATLIRLVKTLLLKVLASSFHVSTYFDRIQEALFNQYVIETLSGPPLVDENHVLEEVHELQRAGATIPKELRDAVPTKHVSGQRNIQLSGVMPKGEGSKQLSKEKGEGISIDALHKLNQKNISAWNMKRLMRIVRFGTLTTMDEQIQQATGQGDESATQIRSEYEAKIAAKKIFHNVAKPGSK